MGPMTEQEVKQNRVTFVKLDKKTGKWEIEGEQYPGISGEFCGFNFHEYEYEGDKIKVFDIYIKANNLLYDLQFGFYTYTTLGILNTLKNADLKYGAKLEFVSRKKDKNINIWISCNNVSLKWKFNYQELKLDIADKDKQTKRKNTIVDTWFNEFLDKYPFVKPEINGNGNSTNEENNTEFMDADDEVPF